MLLEAMNSDIFRVNMDEDEDEELLISIAVVHSGFWGGGILLYECADGQYDLIGEADIGGWTWGTWGFDVFEVADHTGDGQPEVYVRRNDGIRIAGFEALAWDGADFTQLQWMVPWTEEPLGDIYANGMGFSDNDGDGVDEVSLYFHDDARERDFAYYDIYEIHDGMFTHHCQIYLGNEPFFFDPSVDYVIEVVEEADSIFRCGYDDRAEPLFQRVLDDASLEELFTGNLGELYERENLRAFSLYRLVLLNARRGDGDAAVEAYAQLREEYPTGEPGSTYADLAGAFWLAYEDSGDYEAACAALNDYAAPLITEVLEDDSRFAYGLYISSVAGQPGLQPDKLIRACPPEDPPLLTTQ